MLALLEELAAYSTAGEITEGRAAAARAGSPLEGAPRDPRDLVDEFIERARPLVRANREGGSHRGR